MTSVMRALHGSVTPDYILHEMSYAIGLQYMLSEMVRQGGKFAWEHVASEAERVEERSRALVLGNS